MGLASQSARSGSRRAYMSSRRKRRRPIWPWLIVIVALAAVGWWWLRGDDTDPPRTTVTEPGPATTATTASTPTATPPATPPAEITFDLQVEGDLRDGARNPEAPTPVRRRPPVTSRPAESTPATRATPTPTIATPTIATPAPSTPAPSAIDRPTSGRTTSAVTALQDAVNLVESDPVAARTALSLAWLAGLDDPHRSDARRLSRRLADSTLLESPGRPSTPYARPHRVLPNEVLGRIIRNESVEVNADFLARINGLRSANSVRAGRDLWLPNGRFHAVVDLSARDLAVFQEMDGRRDLLVVMPVGIGTDGLTPTGIFRVKPGSKSSNPSWTDPASGRHWDANDVGNPIGEHWIGLEAIDEDDRSNPAYRSLGLHGTTEPQTVGTPCTNGSLRLLGDDVELLFQILGSGTSTVEIRD